MPADRNHQRGIFGLSTLVSLAIYAGIAVAALGAIYAFDRSRQNIGAERVRAEMAPITEACRTFAEQISPSDCAGHMRTAIADRDTALAGNAKLQADLARLILERQACSDAVTKLEQRAARAAAAAAARKPADDKRLAEITPALLEAIDVLGLPEPAGSCEQRLALRDARLAKLAAQRSRDYPGGAEAPKPLPGGLSIGVEPAAQPVRPPAVNPLRRAP